MLILLAVLISKSVTNEACWGCCIISQKYTWCLKYVGRFDAVLGEEMIKYIDKLINDEHNLTVKLK